MADNLKSEREKLAPMLARTNAALRDLAAGNGTYWKEAVGELHAQTNDIPTWILLYEDVNLVETHAAVCETLKPHMEGLAPFQVVLFYELCVQRRAFGATLSGNEAIFSAGADGKMNLNWFPKSDGLSTLFCSRNSSRTAGESAGDAAPNSHR